ILDQVAKPVPKHQIINAYKGLYLFVFCHLFTHDSLHCFMAEEIDLAHREVPSNCSLFVLVAAQKIIDASHIPLQCVSVPSHVLGMSINDKHQGKSSSVFT